MAVLNHLNLHYAEDFRTLEEQAINKINNEHGIKDKSLLEYADPAS